MTLHDAERRPAGEPDGHSADHQAGGITADSIDRQTGNVENAVIGALVLAADCVREVMLHMLVDDDLGDSRARFLLTTVRAMVAEGVPVDTLTVVEYINSRALLQPGEPRMGVASLLYRMTNSAPVPLTGPWYAALAIEARARRRIGFGGQEMMRVANAGSLAELRQICTAEFVAVMEIINRAEQAVRFNA